jgi:hypothetical protein
VFAEIGSEPTLIKPAGLGQDLIGQYRGYDPGTNDEFKNKHENQWKLPQSDRDFIEQFTAGARFRFTGDSTIYTVAQSNVGEPRKIYNHTPWRKMWKDDGTSTGTLVGMGNSVEEAAVEWADSTDTNGKNGTSGLVNTLIERIENFGKANNRRVSYMIMLSPGEDPTAGGTTYDPLTSITATSANGVDVVLEAYDSSSSTATAGKVVEFPAIWETEPKDNVDLDIYYEASQAYPTTITKENRELFAPVGCRVTIPNYELANSGISWDNHIVSWEDSHDGLQIITVDNGFNLYVPAGTSFFPGQPYGTGSTPVLYDGRRIKFTREDGSYTVGKITVPQAGLLPSGNYSKRFRIETITEDGGSGSDYHVGETGLNWYNCFSFGNGIESNRIRDDFNAMTITNGVRANATLDKPYTEEHRKGGLIYSGIYNSTNGINNLNQFIMAEKITKDLNPTYGSIQKLYDRVIRQSSSLIAFCEDRIVSIISNKDALYNADGNPQIVASSAVLGDANAFVGDYGISQNPESFAKDSYRSYFTDKQRGAVLRLSMDGLTPISDAGMGDWFKDQLKNPMYNIIGSFDTYKNNYNLTLDGGTGTMSDSYTVTYSEDVKGWVSFKSFIQESGVSVSGDYYTFKAGKCYKHDNETRNTFYGASVEPSTIKFVFNESPTVIKNFNTLNYDGDETWTCSSVITDQQSGTVNSFVEKEGKFFNYIKGDINAALDTSEFNFQGIGTASNVQYSVGPPVVADYYGCTSITAINYEPLANVDNGTCVQCVYGCTNTTADNYDVPATCDDGSCVHCSAGEFFSGGVCVTTVYGCTDPTALCNYDPSANIDDGSCLYILGCTVSGYVGYDPAAECNDGSCGAACVYGCTNSTYVEYNPLANCDDGSCTSACVFGCTDSSAFNYNQFGVATCDDGSCIGCVYGCTQGQLVYPQVNSNYNDNATCNDGSCIACVYGCMTSTGYSNYNSNATCPDGSCLPCISGCTDSTASNYDSNATCDEGNCVIIYGCMTGTTIRGAQINSNYNPLAGVDDGSCTACAYGCMDSNSPTYDSSATCAGMLTYDACEECVYGCIDSSYVNYDSNASCMCGDNLHATHAAGGSVAAGYPVIGNNLNGNGSCCVTVCTYGCMNTNYQEYSHTATCGDEATYCLTPYIYGCMDSAAANYDSTATASLPLGATNACYYISYGPELVTNGDFSISGTVSQTGWVLSGSNVPVIANGELSGTGMGGNVFQDITSLTTGATYKLTCDITSGSSTMFIIMNTVGGQQPGVAGVNRLSLVSGNTYEAQFEWLPISNAYADRFYFKLYEAGLTIDNISLREVTIT